MEIKALPLGPISVNCYMLLTEKAAVVIDPGYQSNQITEFLKENAALQRLILITHSHFDHIMGAKGLREETDTKIGIGERDEAGLHDSARSLADHFRARQEPFYADMTFHDGEVLTVGDMTVQVIETPGHTAGGVCYLIGDCLFSGDTLFLDSIGRTDFAGCDHDAMLCSLKRLAALDGDIKVYPGHGGTTTIGHEKRNNPYLG